MSITEDRVPLDRVEAPVRYRSVEAEHLKAMRRARAAELRWPEPSAQKEARSERAFALQTQSDWPPRRVASVEPPPTGRHTSPAERDMAVTVGALAVSLVLVVLAYVVSLALDYVVG